MRLPTLNEDFWALVSGEERHAAAPEKFWIPSLAERESLKIGQAAKLIFEIESEDENGNVERDRERMWVVVTDIVGPFYVGRLANLPVTFNECKGFYLAEDVEIPFLPMHIIDISQPPEEYLHSVLAKQPKRVWPRT